jgi:nucleotide-binding universal stress UspA family protein
MEKEAQAALEALDLEGGEPTAPVSLHVEHGVAPEQILRFAVTNSSELLVVASHGLTGVSHLLMGSVSERVVREAPCPVLTIKSFGKTLLPRSTGAIDRSATEKRDGGRRASQERPC